MSANRLSSGRQGSELKAQALRLFECFAQPVCECGDVLLGCIVGRRAGKQLVRMKHHVRSDWIFAGFGHQPVQHGLHLG